MSRQIFDLAVSLESGLPSDPPNMIPEITYRGHAAGAQGMQAYFPGLTAGDLPRGLGWAVEEVRLTTHSGTHLDAPFHYHPTQDQGRPALTIDQVPLDWCYQDGVLLDFSRKPDGQGISAAEVEAELAHIGHQLKPLDIVLVRVGADKAWGRPEYLVTGAGMTRESTLYLLERGVKVVGIDAWSWDRPLPFLAKEFAASGDASIVWAAHFAGIERGYCHMEKLAGLGALPRPSGFKVACFPIKIKGASAGWVRPVAIFED
ncbi:MAG: cyclase family protein [Desulfarculus sp.]|jgi:kynurenine formamidase|nr:MAG: cyclase family protein [Desulfarculus sp.]